jgi:hypothetical protein
MVLQEYKGGAGSATMGSSSTSNYSSSAIITSKFYVCPNPTCGRAILSK